MNRRIIRVLLAMCAAGLAFASSIVNLGCNGNHHGGAAFAIASVGSISAAAPTTPPPPKDVVLNPFRPSDPLYVTDQADYLQNEHHLEDAWQFGNGLPADGNKLIVVAVIDNGFSHHEDLEGQYLPEFSKNFIDGTNDPFPSLLELELAFGFPFDHGTGTTSILAAPANAKGMLGIAPRIKLVLIQALTVDGFGDYDTLAAAIDYARTLKVDVISMSWGGYFEGSPVREATMRAYLQGIILVAAAGNDANRSDTPDQRLYPAGYPWVISVGATTATVDPDGTTWINRAPFSAFGQKVDIHARGVQVEMAQGYMVDLDNPFIDNPDDPTYPFWNIQQGNFYEKNDGTSFSTPITAGAVALALAQNPGLSQEEMKNLLQSTADPLFGEEQGTLNIGRLVQRTNSMPVLSKVPPTTLPADSAPLYGPLVLTQNQTDPLQKQDFLLDRPRRALPLQRTVKTK